MTQTPLDAFDEWYRTYFDIENMMTNPGHRFNLWAAWCAGIAWASKEFQEDNEP